MGEPDVIKNEIEKKYKRKKDGEEKEVVVPKSAVDIQKMQLERLMKDPDKPVDIPEARKQWQPRGAPEFVRHVMGSSAGAGSGEFHVYRGIRRREMNRTKFIEDQAEKEKLNEEYHKKLEENKAQADAKTAKKRAKRLKKKQKQLLAKKLKNDVENNASDVKSESENEESNSESEDEPHFVIGGK